MHLFFTPWKHQKTYDFSDVFRGCRKRPVIWNGITWFMDVSLCYQILYYTFRGIIKKCNNNANLSCYNHFEGTDLSRFKYTPTLLSLANISFGFWIFQVPLPFYSRVYKVREIYLKRRVFYNNSCKRCKINSKTPSMEFFFSKVPCPDNLIRKRTHAFTFFRTVFLRLYTRACFGLLFSIGWTFNRFFQFFHKCPMKRGYFFQGQ